MTWEVFMELADNIKNYLNKQNYVCVCDVYMKEFGHYVLQIETNDSVRIMIVYMNQAKEFRIGLIKHRNITDERIWIEARDICESSRELLVQFIENDPTYRMKKLFHASGLIADYYTNALSRKKKELNIL